uniref:Uncharacterized protein n=1 Tax=Tanacetum cinerariifolium TaxID=118510 RepID=A0A6L2KEG4_TANCI|nr:hypothetical protein [Tanacetum cinerariifolium]
MVDDHLSTILETKSDEVIKSSVKNLVPILSESEGISNDTCDVPVCEDSSTIDTLKGHSEILSDSNNDGTSSDDNAFEDINDSFFEESDTSLSYLGNSLPELETFNHTKETSSGSTTTHADNSLPEYESFLFKIELDQGELTNVVMETILEEPRVHMLNILPTQPNLDSDFTPSNDSLGSSLEVEFVRVELYVYELSEFSLGISSFKLKVAILTQKRDLQIGDEGGVDCLPNEVIFEQITLLGAKTTAWNEFSSTMACAEQVLDVSKICSSLLNNQLAEMANHTKIYVTPCHTKKIFGNMKRVGKDFSARVTPLFPTMMVQAQEEMGKESVADEAVHKVRGDSLVRATTTASSLETEHDSGNIAKTQSKAIPNKSSSQGTDLSGGPRCQEAMEDTSAHTRYERVSKISNDLLLTGVNTPRSREDSLKHIELMKICTTLQKKVLDLKDELKRTKTAQQTKIDSLERRVKKLEKKYMLKSHKLKRLYKVGLTARVISSSDDKGLGEEDASKQGMIIDDHDADEDITLVNDQEMFDVDKDLQGDELEQESSKKQKIDDDIDTAELK